jgi:hypothetical protein
MALDSRPVVRARFVPDVLRLGRPLRPAQRPERHLSPLRRLGAAMNPTHNESRFSVTVAATADMPGVDEAEAWRRAREIERKVRNVLAENGVLVRDPLVNVWSEGGGPILG